MKQLNKKVFITIYGILSLFLFFGIFLYNVQIYRREYEDIYRNLTFMEENRNRTSAFDWREPVEKDIDDMMIMDHEVYTILLNGTSISRILYHGNQNSSFPIEEVVSKIVSSSPKLKIGNLYYNLYSYYYHDNSIVIIRTEEINQKLLITLFESIVFLFLMEAILYMISKMLTKRITTPAEEAFQKQKDFIADASHELKTPLAVIMASSDSLEKNKKNEKYIDNIKVESERMNKLIRNLLDLSKLENQSSKESYTEENLTSMIEKIGLTYEGYAFENQVNIDMKLEKNIFLSCMKEEMEELFVILLDNAIEHAKEKSTIFLILKQEKGNILFQIVNSGEAISKEEEERIFERFYRSDKSRKRKNGHYGLGLAIAKSIVKNHNGSIKAFSKNGKTTFEIYFKK